MAGRQGTFGIRCWPTPLAADTGGYQVAPHPQNLEKPNAKKLMKKKRKKKLRNKYTHTALCRIIMQ
jgi:hypothetical protein